MHNAFLGVKPATIEWRQFDPEKHQWLTVDERPLENSKQLAPYSPAFNDIYFNPEDGIAESTHVFLEGNQLKERFHSLHQSAETQPFHIFETGFGTGLNFLLTAKQWQETQASHSKAELHFWSVEQYPISPDSLRQIYQVLDIESELSESLIEHYPDALPGIYSLQISSNITLHLIFYPLAKTLREVALPRSFSFDAWFLDGFAPSKNPEMWAKSLLHFMALHSSKETTLATFTVASALRKPLPHYGFQIEKRPGFGRKREMLIATFAEKELTPLKPTLADAYIQPQQKPRVVAVIGAGLAGCSLVYQLLQENIKVHLFDKSSDFCSGASNMPSLVASPAMSIDHNAYSQLTFLGLERLQEFIAHNPELAQSTLAHQLSNEKYSQHHLEQYQDIYSAQTWQGKEEWFSFQDIKIGAETLHALKIPAIQVNGKAFCQRLLKDLPTDHLHLNTNVTHIKQLEAFDHVILANGHQASKLTLGHSNKSSLNDTLPQIAPMRGQLTTLKGELDHRTPINHDGHIAHHKNQLVIGATFENSSNDCISRENSLQNTGRVNQRFGFEFTEKDIAKEHSGVRATSYDRFPFCGHFAQIDDQHIWLNYGFGARGLCFSMLCAEVIVNALTEQPSPLPKNLLNRISPLRI